MLEIRRIQEEARASGKPTRPRWPMIVLRSPKGWTGPKEVDGHKVEGFWRSHQVPLAGVRENPAHLKLLEDWLRSYRPEELFDETGRLIPELKSAGPHRYAPHERQSSRQWRPAAKGLAPAGLPRLCHRSRKARADRGREHSPPRPIPARHHAPESEELSRLRTRRKHLEQAWMPSTRSARNCGWPTTCPRMPTAASCPPMAACSKCSPSTRWRAGLKATCSPADTDSSPPTKPSSTSSTPCSTCMPSGSRLCASYLGVRPCRRSTC